MMRQRQRKQRKSSRLNPEIRFQHGSLVIVYNQPSREAKTVGGKSASQWVKDVLDTPDGNETIYEIRKKYGLPV